MGVYTEPSAGLRHPATPEAAPVRLETSGAERRRRHVGRRLAAFLVDTCLLAVLIFLGAAALSAILGPAVRFAAGPGGLDQVVFDDRVVLATRIASIAVGCAYFCVSWALLRATPAQRLLGLEVRDRQHGGSPTPARAVARWAALGAPLWIAASALPGGAGVAAGVGLTVWFLCLLLTTAWSATGQGLHDRLSGTLVVRADGSQPAPIRKELHVR